jgi:hypothetical protein
MRRGKKNRFRRGDVHFIPEGKANLIMPANTRDRIEFEMRSN